MDNTEGKTYVLNSIGSRFALQESVLWVWKRCDGNTSKKQIIKQFKMTFNLSQKES